MERQRLKDRIAIVTGASRGIGRAIALQFAKDGAKVVVNYRSSETEASEVAQAIEELGSAALLVQADVGDRPQAHRLVDSVIEQWGGVDVLVNNAGITRDRTILKLADEDWDDVIKTNLGSVYNCSKAVIPIMVKQGYGRIVNISSFVGQAGNFGQSNYGASKGGIIAFTKSAAIELARFGITVNAIAPGFTETGMLEKVPEKVREQILERIPLRRFGRPEEVAKAVAFVAGEGDYITGQQININGGAYM